METEYQRKEEIEDEESVFDEEIKLFNINDPKYINLKRRLMERKQLMEEYGIDKNQVIPKILKFPYRRTFDEGFLKNLM